jgi:hypothetical protein
MDVPSDPPSRRQKILADWEPVINQSLEKIEW